MTTAKEQKSPVKRVPVIRTKDLAVDYMSILNTQSKTRDTDAMKAEIFRQIKEIDGVSVETDDYGNIYAVKGQSKTYPAYVCHIDTVHDIRDSYKVLRSDGGCYFAISEDKGELKQVGVGGDDKCGIIVCIEMLYRLKNVKCAFFLDEEGGCLGSEKGNLNFFDNCRWAIQIDRKDKGDIITKGKNGTVPMCSEEFEELISEIGEKYGYKPCTGASTDVVKLKERGMGISCVNLSAGYYNPHRDNEYIVESELLNCLAFAKAMASFTTVYPHKYVPVKHEYSSNHSSSGWSKGSYSSKPQDTKKCAECDCTLYGLEKDNGVCSKCIDGFTEQIYLETNNITKKRSIVIDIVRAPVELPDNLKERLPSKNCLFCSTTVSHKPEEMKRGYCEACAWCGCGKPITTTEGLLGKLCLSCKVAGSDEEDDAICFSPGCGVVLESQEEINNDLCSACTRRYGLFGFGRVH
jgi:tripeptide aminopeptidase